MWRLPDGELARAMLSCQQRLSAEYARMLDLVGEAESRGLAGSLGYRDLVAWQCQELRVSTREAKSRIELASVLMSTTPDGDPSPTGEALREGVLNREQAVELSWVLRQVPAHEYAETEATLVRTAGQAGPFVLRKVGQRVLAYLDQDGKPPDDREREHAEPTRAFRYHLDKQGWMRFSGDIDPETATLLEGLFAGLAKPDPADEAGGADARTLPERQGDALAEIIDAAARSDEVPSKGGERAVVTVTIPLEELERRAQQALLDNSTWATASQLRRLCCQAQVVPAVLGSRSEPLDLGRSVRFAGQAQRRALVIRDRGCAYPGCARSPKWCTPHHRIHWVDGGATELDNLVLLCARHHRQIHHSEWEIRMNHGIPEFIPPPWIDTTRTPQRNTTHDPPQRHAA